MGESRLRREGMSEDSAPDEETEPISSWLKRAMQLMLPSRVEKDWLEADSAMASTALKLNNKVWMCCR